MEGKPQVNSVKRTCGRVEVPRKVDWNVPLQSSWPTFIPLVEKYVSNPSTVVCAYVDKSLSALEVQLNPDLVSALESTPEVSLA